MYAALVMDMQILKKHAHDAMDTVKSTHNNLLTRTLKDWI